ncbi:putative TIM-barrel fold metal-dependent hydrolase [Kibdelosporangium banguiense]|uniref:TIM-barrel fold metal-dependent hydrolase n=1 Tax=Kibdelosporangium banguiense TaxID=1365924 RepID=A0ABS4TUE3_9PSEU|nr:amidohydrolase family protein [Kibdelosporangium banguiense]MBP2327566.1 putative TIM-barrel fold metal-dependent hydrolase [Kibdelosporangium banguiense]
MDRIDMHHHALPDGVIELMQELGLPTPVVRWRLETTLDVMDANKIEASVISNVFPCDVLGDAALARRLTRQVNEAAAEVVTARPDRFACFAMLPLPYVDLALEEAAYALDDLGAEGVVLLPHGGDRYLGDAMFDPLWAELNRRRAVVLVHPLDLPQGSAPGVPSVFADYLLDTTRGAIHLITSGTLDRYQDMSIILSHAGGFLPYAATRVGFAAALAGVDHTTVRDKIRRFYYDLALSVPSALPSLLATANPGHIVYGTDWSGVPAAVVEHGTRALDETGVLDEATRRAVNRDNALRLLPGLAHRLGDTHRIEHGGSV